MLVVVLVWISPTVKEKEKEGSEGEEKGCEREEKEPDGVISPTGNKKKEKEGEGSKRTRKNIKHKEHCDVNCELV